MMIKNRRKKLKRYGALRDEGRRLLHLPPSASSQEVSHILWGGQAGEVRLQEEVTTRSSGIFPPSQGPHGNHAEKADHPTYLCALETSLILM